MRPLLHHYPMMMMPTNYWAVGFAERSDVADTDIIPAFRTSDEEAEEDEEIVEEAGDVIIAGAAIDFNRPVGQAPSQKTIEGGG